SALARPRLGRRPGRRRSARPLPTVRTAGVLRARARDARPARPALLPLAPRGARAPPPRGGGGPGSRGPCRALGLRERAWRRPPAVRLRVPAGDVAIDDALQGPGVQDGAAAVGGLALRRGHA